MPKLLTPQIQTKVEDIIERVLATSPEHPLELRAMLRIGEGAGAWEEFTNFAQAIDHDKNSDPISPWFAGAPRTQVLNVGNIIKIFKRPDIPLQKAETIYADGNEYQMHHIYSAAYENDFNKLAATGFEGVEFTTRMISMTSSIAGPNALPAAYLCFIGLDKLNVEVPEIGSRLKVALSLPQPPAQVWSDQTQPAATSQPQPAAIGQPLLAVTSQELPRPDVEVEGSSDTDDEDILRDDVVAQDDYFDDHEDNLAKQQDPNVWNGTIIECVLTPPGHLCCLLERRYEPNWQGPKGDRPLVLTTVPCISDHLTSLASMEKALVKAPVVEVGIELDHSQQPYKDEVRSCDKLFSSRSPDKISLRDYIMCPTAADLEPINLLEHMGPLDTTKNFSPSQRKFYDSLQSVKKGIAILNAPFGTGKTTMALAIMLKMQSGGPRKDSRKCQVVYTTSSNVAVDDAARRYAKLAEEHGMTHLNIIRAHSLKSEKSTVFHGKNNRKSRFKQVDDTILNEFLATAYTMRLGESHEARRKNGDPRRVLEDLSLAAAMVKYLDEHQHDLALRRLKRELDMAATQGMEGLDREQIKMEVNDLMARTLRDADAIFCTLNAITKVKMVENINPDLMINDESCRATELSILAMFAFYSPLVWMFLGDPKQLRPTLLSAGREKGLLRSPIPQSLPTNRWHILPRTHDTMWSPFYHAHRAIQMPRRYQLLPICEFLLAYGGRR